MNRVNPSLGTMNYSSRNNQPRLSPERPESHGWPPSFPAPPTYRNLLDWDCTVCSSLASYWVRGGVLQRLRCPGKFPGG